MNRITRAITGTLAGAALFGTAFAGIASAQDLDEVLIPETTVNICAFLDFEDFGDVLVDLDAALGNTAEDRILPGVVNLDVLSSLDLDRLGLERTESRDAVSELRERLRLDQAGFNRLSDQCGDATPTTTVTTPPTTTTAPPTVTATRTAEPTSRAPVNTDFTVPRGSVDTGAP